MPNVIRVRDVSRDAKYDLGPDVPVLLVPYELFQPIGAVRRRGGLVDWLQGDVIRSGRAVEGVLGTAQPGERVLLRIDEESSADDEWWLCEIEAVNGVAGQ
jgi:hypothetical protein